MPSNMNANNGPFVRVKDSFLLAHSPSNDEDNDARIAIPFDPSWLVGLGPALGDASAHRHGANYLKDLPSHLPAATFVQVFQYDDTITAATTTIPRTSAARTTGGGSGDPSDSDDGLKQQLGRAAREIVDSSTADAVLFRNLSRVVRNAEDFATFWKGCLDGQDGWMPMPYIPFGSQRTKLDGVDLVTPFPPLLPLPCHNEMAYNPREAGRIAFFCLQSASEGGETILARNADLTRVVSKDLQRMVRERGGILYRREYRDGNAVVADKKKPTGFEISWQDKTGANRRDEAVKFFADIGFTANEVYFDENGTLIVQNIHSGFLSDSSADGKEQLWFNILHTGMFKLADGTSVPKDMMDQLKKDTWEAVHGLKLWPGDWIVLNNRAVQHGRLPFVDSPDKKRTILTVYTE